MIGKVARQGHSFKGAGQYYLHDKKAQTSDRVIFTQTLNMATNDPQQAMRHMAYTAMNAEAIKQQYNAQYQIQSGGNAATKGAVYAFSLSWHHSETPDTSHMLRTAHSALACLGLTQHEAVIVAHNDTKHPHVHIIVNLVHPDTGRRADTYLDQKKLSAWAYEYEQEHGLFCHEREGGRHSEVNDTERQKEHPEHSKPQELRQRISLFYETSRSLSEFGAMLKDEGFTLAQGNKQRLVLVDEQGKITNLTRYLPKGIGKKQILLKFSDLNTDALPVAALLSDMRQAQNSTSTHEQPSQHQNPQSRPSQAAYDNYQPILSYASAVQAMQAKRQYQQQQAMWRKVRIEAMMSLCNASYKQPPLVSLSFDNAFKLMQHYSQKLTEQPVRLMERIKQGINRLWQATPFASLQPHQQPQLSQPSPTAYTELHQQQKITQPQHNDMDR